VRDSCNFPISWFSWVCCVFDVTQTLQQMVSKSWFNLIDDVSNIRHGGLTLDRDAQVWDYVCRAQIWVILVTPNTLNVVHIQERQTI